MSRRVLAIAGGALVVVLLTWYVLLWSPKGSQIDDAHERKAAAEAQFASLQVQVAEAKAAKAREPQLVASLDQLAVAVPAEAELAELILALDEAGRFAGVDLLAISPALPKASTVPGGPAEIVVAMSFEASYWAVLNFQVALLHLPRLFVIDSIQVAPNGGDTAGSGDRLQVTLTGRTFTTEPVAPAPGAAPTTPPAATTPQPATTPAPTPTEAQ